jgi:hypothetical protein
MTHTSAHCHTQPPLDGEPQIQIALMVTQSHAVTPRDSHRLHIALHFLTTPPYTHLGHPLSRVEVLTSRRSRALIGLYTNWLSLPSGAFDSELAMTNQGLSPPGNGERESLQTGAEARGISLPHFSKIAVPTPSQV